VVSNAVRSHPSGTPFFDVGVLVAGEAKADEPLAVELLRCLLQQRHPPPVVLIRLVGGRESLILMNLSHIEFYHVCFNRPRKLTYLYQNSHAL